MKPQKLITRLAAAYMLCLSTAIYSQGTSNPDFGKGTNVINLGIGLGGDYTYVGSGVSSTPNFVISYDNGTFGNVGPGTISLGGLLSYKGASYNYPIPPYTIDQTWYYYIIGFRSAYHWDFTSNPHFDPYAGLMLGYYDVGYKSSSNDPYYNVPGNPYYFSATYGSYFAFSLYIGARYYVSPHVGFWLELGSGYSNLALGVSFKF